MSLQAASTNRICKILGSIRTHPLYNNITANGIGPLATCEQETATTALHYPAGQPAEEEKFTRASAALVLVTYKKLLLGPAPLALVLLPDRPGQVAAAATTASSQGTSPKVAPGRSAAPERGVDPEPDGVGPALPVVIVSHEGLRGWEDLILVEEGGRAGLTGAEVPEVVVVLLVVLETRKAVVVHTVDVDAHASPQDLLVHDVVAQVHVEEVLGQLVGVLLVRGLERVHSGRLEDAAQEEERRGPSLLSDQSGADWAHLILGSCSRGG